MNPQDQTTEPKTAALTTCRSPASFRASRRAVAIASLYEKGVFVTPHDYEDLLFDDTIHEASQTLIQAVSSIFKLRGTHFSIMVRPVEATQERRVCLLRDGAVAVTVKKN